MRALLFLLVPIAVVALALIGHHGGLSPGHALLHAATVILASALLYLAAAAYARTRTPRFAWILAAFLLLLARELALSLSMYTGNTWRIPGTDVPLDHFIGLLALTVLAYALFVPAEPRHSLNTQTGRSPVSIRPLLLAAAVAAVAAAAYILLAKPYVKDAAYAMTAPDVGMLALTIVNPTPFPTCVVAVEVLQPPGVKAELHRTVVNGTVVAMQHVDRICVPPLSTLDMSHMGYHIMLQANSTVEGTLKALLRLDNGAAIAVEATPQATPHHH